MKHVKRLRLFFFLVLIVFLSACKKHPLYPTNNSGMQNFIEILFDVPALPLNTVDSVIAVFNPQSGGNAFTRKMSMTAQGFQTSVNDIPPASYLTELVVYQKKLPGAAYSYLYKLKKNVSLPLQSRYTVTGPTGNYAGDWAPYFVFKNEAMDVTLIIAERVEDPYFAISAPTLNGLHGSLLDRATYGTNYLADHGSWTTITNPFVSCFYSNSASFADFAERMKLKTWASCQFSFYIEDGTGKSASFDLLYYPRP